MIISLQRIMRISKKICTLSRGCCEEFPPSMAVEGDDAPVEVDFHTEGALHGINYLR